MIQNDKKIEDARLALYKDKLLKEKETLLKELEEIGKGNLKVLQSEATGETPYDEHMADSGTYTFERERDLSLENNIRDILAKIDAALEKLNKHTYGVCDRCGNLIDPARLKALPYANLCINCKKEEEKIG